MPQKSFILAGGGTGGHIYPAISIASGLKKIYPDANIVFVGTERGLEKDLVPKAGFTLRKIRVKGFNRRLSIDTLRSVREMLLGGIDSIKVLREIKPDIVIGTGGYVAGPIIFFASMMGIPTMIHEQNVKPGITNRILSHFVKRVAISFQDSIKYFPKGKTILTGNPVRAEIAGGNKGEALKKFGFVSSLPVVLCFGGSQGAARLNDAMLYVIEKLKNKKTFQLIHVTGQKHYGSFRQLLENKGVNLEVLGHIKLRPYIYDMQDAYAAADLVIARAGAISVSEITLCAKPAILIPFPKATGHHQDYNADFLQKNGAALVISDKDLSGELLLNTIESVISDRHKLLNMARASKKLAKPEALEKILDEIKSLID